MRTGTAPKETHDEKGGLIDCFLLVIISILTGTISVNQKSVKSRNGMGPVYFPTGSDNGGHRKLCLVKLRALGG